MTYEYQQYLSHHGIKGQKWGVRRFQNEDGSLTEEGRKKYLAETERQMHTNHNLSRQYDAEKEEIKRKGWKASYYDDDELGDAMEALYGKEVANALLKEDIDSLQKTVNGYANAAYYNKRINQFIKKNSKVTYDDILKESRAIAKDSNFDKETQTAYEEYTKGQWRYMFGDTPEFREKKKA